MVYPTNHVFGPNYTPMSRYTPNKFALLKVGGYEYLFVVEGMNI